MADLTVADIVRELRRNYRLILGWPLIAGVATAGIVLVIAPRFRAEATFVTDAPSRPSIEGVVGGLAAQASALLGGGSAQGPLYFAAVLRSRGLLEDAVLAKYPRVENSADSNSLLDAYDAKGETQAVRVDEAISQLGKRMVINVDRQAGLVSVSVEDESPARAAEVANRLVALLDQFNSERKRSRAGLRRAFIEGRLKDGLTALTTAENNVGEFEDRNRQWRSSPPLQLEHDRLARQVQVNQEVYLTLRREYETARIDEVNNVTVLTVVDRAVAPIHKSYPQRTLSVLVAMFLAGTAALLVAASMGPGHEGPLGLWPFGGGRSRRQ